MEHLQAAITSRPRLPELLQAVAALQVCGGCTLRLAAVREAAAYSSSGLPRTAAGVVSALQAPSAGSSAPAAAAPVKASGSAPGATPVLDHAAAQVEASEGSKRRKLDPVANDSGVDAAAAPRQPDGPARCAAGQQAAPPVCPLCLGLLQAAAPAAAGDGDAPALRCPIRLATTISSLNDPGRHDAAAAGWGAGGAAPVSAIDAAAVAAAETGSNHAAPVVEQHGAAAISLAAAAAGIATEFELGPSFGLDITLPASLAVRQQALSWRLRQREGQEGLATELAAAIEVKEAVKLLYGSQLAAALGVRLDPHSDLRLALSVTHPDAAAECGWLAGGGGGSQKRRGWYARQRQEQRQQQQQQQQPAGEVPALTESVLQRLAAMTLADFGAGCPAGAAQLAAPAAAATVQLQARRRPLHVGGRYLKLRRGIPQSPWFIDGQRKGEGSVQEAIEAAVLPAFQADSYTMQAAGREDIDVRMLGGGRPFILEIHNARRGMPPPEAMQRTEAAVSEVSAEGVAVRGLHAASAAQLALLKAGEQEKQKSYVAVCWLPRPLTDGDAALLEGTRELVLRQQTPVRVLHRRANLERPKTVHEMRAQRLPGQPDGYFALRLRTQAGTYIKEFVHGDLGRTQPCLGDLLGCKAQIVSLDVLDIHMEFGAGAE